MHLQSPLRASPFKQLEPLTKPLRKVEEALGELDLAVEMIPSHKWFLYAFVHKEVLLSSKYFRFLCRH